MAASVEVDQAQVNRLLLDLVAIGERHGIRFPREQWLVLHPLLACVHSFKHKRCRQHPPACYVQGSTQ
jgi:hypothetical protein